MKLNYFLLPIAVFAYCLVLNFSKFEASFIKATIHLLLQFLFVYSLIALVSKFSLVRFILALFLSVELYTFLTYQTSFSISLAMSIATSSISEAFSFLSFNWYFSLSVFLFLIIASVAPVIKKASVSYSFFALGSLYIFVPALMISEEVFKHKEYKNYYHTGLARGYYPLYIKAEYLIRKDIYHRFPAFKSFRGIVDTAMFFSITNSDLNDWTNVGLKESDNSNLIVLGIGESLRAENMGIYGYSRDTTPFLSSITSELEIVSQVYSAGPNTWNSLPAMLGSFNNRMDLSKSVINLANQAGYKTYWVSNHAKTSHWDFSVSRIADQASENFFYSINTPGSVYDMELVKQLEQIINSPYKKKFIVLHFYGSHMTFTDRYPKEFSIFNGTQKFVDEYDNTIYYTDAVHKKIIELIKKNNGKYLFLADHGLGNPSGEIPLKHDVRDVVDIDSLNVPLISYPKNDFLGDLVPPISLLYFECIFAGWASISADDLNYCDKALNKEYIEFIDVHLKYRKATLIESERP